MTVSLLSDSVGLVHILLSTVYQQRYRGTERARPGPGARGCGSHRLMGPVVSDDHTPWQAPQGEENGAASSCV